MFEIGFPELVLIAIVGLLVIGPERLPEALRTLGLWLGRMRRSFTSVKAEIEKEIGMDEVKRQLHNEAIMEEMKRIEAEVKSTADSARGTLQEGMDAASLPPGAITPPAIDPGASVADAVAAQDSFDLTPENKQTDADQSAEVDDSSSADDRLAAADHSEAGDRSHADAAAGPADDRSHADAAESADDRSHADAAEPLDTDEDTLMETQDPERVKSG